MQDAAWRTAWKLDVLRDFGWTEVEPDPEDGSVLLVENPDREDAPIVVETRVGAADFVLGQLVAAGVSPLEVQAAVARRKPPFPYISSADL